MRTIQTAVSGFQQVRCFHPQSELFSSLNADQMDSFCVVAVCVRGWGAEGEHGNYQNV